MLTKGLGPAAHQAQLTRMLDTNDEAEPAPDSPKRAGKNEMIPLDLCFRELQDEPRAKHVLVFTILALYVVAILVISANALLSGADD